MDATATPRGISLAVGELGARGRPINKQCTAVRISSAVNGDMCGTCQGWLAFCPVCRPLRETDARNPRLLFPHPPSLCVRCRVCPLSRLGLVLQRRLVRSSGVLSREGCRRGSRDLSPLCN